MFGIIEEFGFSLREGVQVIGSAFHGLGRVKAAVARIFETAGPVLALSAVLVVLWGAALRAYKGPSVRAGGGCRTSYAQASRATA